jgi:hypothetical protein
MCIFPSQEKFLDFYLLTVGKDLKPSGHLLKHNLRLKIPLICTPPIEEPMAL